MDKKIIITNVNEHLISAEIYDNKCFGLHVFDDSSITGNIYVGRVENVVKNINCAFIEIQKGVKCYYSLDANKRHIFLNRKNNSDVNIGDIMLVQISSDAIKTKPATATCKLSLTGQFLVISSDVKGISISSKTKKNEHCRKLKEELIKYTSDGFGFILRTNSANADLQMVLDEAELLISKYRDILDKAAYCKAFTQLYKSPGDYIEVIKSIHSLQQESVEIITDVENIYDNIKTNINIEHLSLRLYKDELLPLYKLYSLETELDRALNKKVWLKSGGYLIIEQTEALTVIDVNTGKKVNKKKNFADKENSFVETNTEAAVEIARQMRLRNLSGIIIVDFINMSDDKDKEDLLIVLKKLFKQDTLNASVIDITKLGLVEITRKKFGKSLQEVWNN